MNAYPRILIFAVLAIATGQGLAAEVGRVVLAAGDTTALRQGQVVRLSYGTPVQDQDTLRTGAASNLQVRFEDDSYIAMRPDSELRVREFNFSGKDDGSERAIFNLLKGGMRAITGLIGRREHANYRMETATSTIGIRGTDYAATECNRDCRNPDGTLARDGTYGRVLGQSQGTNQIEVSNDVDRKVFGMNSNFFVGGRNSPVESLLVLPDFVLSKLEGRGKGGSAGGTGSEQASSGGAAEESRPSTTPPPLQPLQFVVTQDLNPQGTSSVLPPANGWVVVYPLPINAPFGDVVFDDQTPGTFNGQNQLIAYGTGAFPTGSLGGGSITDTGSVTASNGQVFSWGRWTGPTTVVLSEGGTFSGAPVLFGTASGITQNNSVVGSLGGVATYTYWGGPKPVDGGGNVGSITSTSTTINFTTQTQQLALGINFPSIVVSGIDTGPAVFDVSGQGFPSPARNTGELAGFLTGTCRGNGCYAGLSGSASGYFSTGLTGPNGYGIAVVGGLLAETNAGDVAFLNAYQLSSVTPQMTGQIAFFTSPSNLPQPFALPTNSVQVSGNSLVAFSDPSNTLTGSIGTGSFAPGESSTTPLALVDGGTMVWGRWIGPGLQVTQPSAGTTAINQNAGLPYVLGSANTIVPASGSFLYTYAGGPKPVDANGVTGTFNSGSFQVGFGATQSVVANLNMTVNGATYIVAGTASSTGPSVTLANITLSGSCSGPCSPGAIGNVSGILVGPNAGGLAAAGTVSAPGPAPVIFAGAFKRLP